MRAKDVMSNGVLTVKADATVFDVAELLVNAQVSAVPVVDKDGKIAGIVSEADLMRRAEIGTVPHKSWLLRLFADDVAKAADYVRSHARHAADVMTKPVVTADEEASLGEIAKLMAKHEIKRVPIVRDGCVVGIVSRANLLQALMSREPANGSHPSDEELRGKVAKAADRQPWSSAWATNVLVSQGVVHLWGFVQSEAVRNAYRVAAENVPGVKGVKNHMRLIPPSARMRI